MGICYQLIMEDEYDWGYSETSKDRQLKEFEGKFGRYIERIAEWPHIVVYDIDKASPHLDERRKLIREYADRAYYRSDLGNGITEIELPYNRPSIQTEIDIMNARRTPEEKLASEELVKQKILKMEIK